VTYNQTQPQETGRRELRKVVVCPPLPLSRQGRASLFRELSNWERT
jgi:hypothetical protein